MLFMVQWQINHDQKMMTWETFTGMTPADDAAAEQAHGIRQLGGVSPRLLHELDGCSQHI